MSKDRDSRTGKPYSHELLRTWQLPLEAESHARCASSACLPIITSLKHHLFTKCNSSVAVYVVCIVWMCNVHVPFRPKTDLPKQLTVEGRATLSVHTTCDPRTALRGTAGAASRCALGREERVLDRRCGLAAWVGRRSAFLLVLLFLSMAFNNNCNYYYNRQIVLLYRQDCSPSAF